MKWTWAAAALLVLSCLKDVVNPDLFWHLSAGERLLATREIPTADWLSFTRAGQPWLDFEWLSQLAYALCFRAGGWWALIALKTALLGAAAAAMVLSVERERRAFVLAALAAGWAAVNDVRADNASLALLCLELAALERLRRDSARWSVSRVAVVSALAGSLWANLHAGFPLGLAAAAAYALFGPARARGAYGAIVAAGLLGTLANPFGARLYGVFVEHGREVATLSSRIIEWQWSDPRRYRVWPAWALLAGCFWSFSRRWPKRDAWAPWAVAGGLAVLGIAQQRHVGYFAAAAALVAPPVAAPAAVLAAGIFLARMDQSVSREGWNHRSYPTEAAAFLESRPDVAALRLYNPWDWGGYLGWRLKPPYRVFMDGRYVFHEKLERVSRARRDPGAWNAFLDAEGLDGAIMPRDETDYTLAWEAASGKRTESVVPYHVLFMPTARWKPVYEDATAVLYVRRR